ncbi:hypothetical protein BC777_0177 [Yoonia maricola]|uniref:Uncharacterized protein n=1 Tax=Yoonia maricola TaxID=420999 RepID=A0A2M8WKA6_9RHOB|nr:hypothetical protein [Yoonia maricola]PJI91351.1 hypothetical protein BC777_0177 [Yoonia maricola]
MKTIVRSITFTLAVLSGQTTSAQTFDPEQQLRTFADCAGRLSAVMEYQWMFDGAASEQTKRHRAAVIDLVEATMPPDRGREVLHWRISAKLAQSALLTRATFNADADDAAWALAQAQRFERACTGLLLS